MKPNKLTVFIDNNVWDYFSDNKISLEEYFPKGEFDLCITTHGRYEILNQTPEHRQSVKDYAEIALKTLVREDAIFGYFSELFPKEYQRVAGYNVGRYISNQEAAFNNLLTTLYGTQEKRKQHLILFKKEADIEIASRSILHPVITFEGPSKNDPLQYASQNGGKIIFLDLKYSKQIAPQKFMEELLTTLRRFSD